MGTYRISYYLYRSNPMILRELKIPADYTVRDLYAVFCLAMGIPVSYAALWNENGERVADEETLKVLWGTGDTFRRMTGHAMVFQSEKHQEELSLTFFYEVLEETDEKIADPRIIMGEGYLLPQNVFRISAINEMYLVFQTEESYSISGIGTFYKGQQSFQLKKTQNYISSYFAPDKVSTLKTELSVPLTTILENRTMADLRSILDQLHGYTYNNRKADYIAAIDYKLQNVNPQKVFYEMDILEYLKFRELVMKGSGYSSNEELKTAFPTLYKYGIICYVKKQGVLIASFLMQDYEEWFDEEQETIYRTAKRFESVLHGCAAYYGVFTKSLFRKVSETLYPGEITEEMLDQCWNSPFDDVRLWNVSFSESMTNGERAAYDRSLFNLKEKPLFLSVLSSDSSDRYLPDKTEFERVSCTGCEAMTEKYGELFALINPHTYDKNETDRVCRFCVDGIRKGYRPEIISKEAMKNLHIWSEKELVQKRVEVLLSEMVYHVPCILYYGYSRMEAKEKKISEKMKNEMNRLFEEAAEAEKQKKREAAERRKAEAESKRKSTSRITQIKGKRGR